MKDDPIKIINDTHRFNFQNLTNNADDPSNVHEFKTKDVYKLTKDPWQDNELQQILTGKVREEKVY